MKWDIKKMAKQVLRRSRRLPDRRLIHPEREWLIGLLIFLVLLVVGTVYEINSFMHYSSIEEAVEMEPFQVIEYDEAAASRVLERYEEKARIFNRVLESYGGQAGVSSVDQEADAGETGETDAEEGPGQSVGVTPALN